MPLNLCFVKNVEVDKVLDAFSWRLKMLRKKQNISQEDLAHAAGLSLSQIARIETSKTNPSLIVLIKIANALNLTLEELLKDLDKLQN